MSLKLNLLVSLLFEEFLVIPFVVMTDFVDFREKIEFY